MSAKRSRSVSWPWVKPGGTPRFHTSMILGSHLGDGLEEDSVLNQFTSLNLLKEILS